MPHEPTIRNDPLILVSIQVDYSNRLISAPEQALYDHLLECINTENPEVMLQRFRTLFIEGTGYSDRDMLSNLDQILADKHVDDYFRHILNRSCHILINRWQSSRYDQHSIVDLVNLFESGPKQQVREVSRARSTRRLREVVGQFTETEQYLMLKRLSQVVAENSVKPKADDQLHPLGNLIGRYPYLYEHCLVSEESPKEHQVHIRRIQGEAQHKFELDLSHYVNYRVRRSRLRRKGKLESRVQHLRPADNPTLLSDRDLVASLKQFTGKVEHRCTYKELAQRFTKQNCQGASFGSFKDDLYSYILSSVDSGYGQRKFNEQLHQQLTSIYPESNQKQLNDFLMVRTCSQLFNFLVVDSSSSREHYVFVDLINNAGPLATTSILLKILLLCRKVRPYLERRFSALFSHYEASTQAQVAWLVNMFENLNIALSLNFGTVDFSHIMR